MFTQFSLSIKSIYPFVMNQISFPSRGYVKDKFSSLVFGYVPVNIMHTVCSHCTSQYITQGVFL